MANSARFRFVHETHEYLNDETGEVYPSITQLIERAGLVDSRWYTDESRDRGTAVHDLTLGFDLGALDVASCVSPYRGYLLAHVAAMQMLRPEILAAEVPRVHPGLRFAGRPDRVVKIGGVLGVLEIKSGAPEPSHKIQCALQCILEADDLRLPAWALGRWCLYIKASGRFTLVRHEDRRDVDQALAIVRRFCGRESET